jgi:hypothetical protein
MKNYEKIEKLLNSRKKKVPSKQVVGLLCCNLFLQSFHYILGLPDKKQIKKIINQHYILISQNPLKKKTPYKN